MRPQALKRTYPVKDFVVKAIFVFGSAAEALKEEQYEDQLIGAKGLLYQKLAFIVKLIENITHFFLVWAFLQVSHW